ncbi:MAG: TolC family protein [Deltaproteobacteria bacterium]|nr:TolC family protein [Deltaproteobacteria bacterium]
MATALIAGSGRAAEPKQTWSWERLLAQVEATHPLMDAAQAGLAQLEAKLGQAEWAIFPSFRLEAGGTITPKITGDALKSDTDWGTVGVFGKLGIDMVQPLWTFGKISALRAAAEAGVEVGHAAVDLARWELRMRAAEAFYGRILAHELEAILDEGKGWIDKAERRMAKLRDEDSPDYDQLEHLRLKTRVADFYTLQAQNELLLVQASQGLRLLLRAEPGTEVTPEPEGLEPLACPLRDPAVYVAAARRHDPTVRVASSTARAQHHLADAKAAEAWPDIVLLGNVDLTEATVFEDQDSFFARDPYHRRSVGAALGLRWKLDVPQRVLQTDEARARARRASSEAEVAGDLSEFKVRGLVQELANKKSLIDVMRQSQKASQGWLTATWDTYEAGFGSFRDVMDALVQFYQKRFGYLQLVFEHNILIWKLNQAIGADACALGEAP